MTPVTISLCLFSNSASSNRRHLTLSMDDAYDGKLPTFAFPVVYNGGAGLAIQQSKETLDAIQEKRLASLEF